MKLIPLIFSVFLSIIFSSCGSSNDDDEVTPSITSEIKQINDLVKVEVKHDVLEKVENKATGKIRVGYTSPKKLILPENKMIIAIKCSELQSKREVPLLNNETEEIKAGAYLVEYSFLKKETSKGKFKSRMPINNISKPLVQIRKIIVVKAGYIAKINVVFQ